MIANRTARTASILNGARSALLFLSTLTIAGLSIAAAVHAEETRDGLYLRGSHPEADVTGESYMVFEVQNGRVVGGFYQPQSSFDCFHGSIGQDYLPLTVVDSYGGSTYQYAMNLSEETIVANASQSTTVVPRDPVGAHAIPEVSETARHVLSSCQSELSGTSEI